MLTSVAVKKVIGFILKNVPPLYLEKNKVELDTFKPSDVSENEEEYKLFLEGLLPEFAEFCTVNKKNIAEEILYLFDSEGSDWDIKKIIECAKDCKSEKDLLRDRLYRYFDACDEQLLNDKNVTKEGESLVRNYFTGDSKPPRTNFFTMPKLRVQFYIEYRWDEVCSYLDSLEDNLALERFIVLDNKYKNKNVEILDILADEYYEKTYSQNFIKKYIGGKQAPDNFDKGTFKSDKQSRRDFFKIYEERTVIAYFQTQLDNEQSFEKYLLSKYKLVTEKELTVFFNENKEIIKEEDSTLSLKNIKKILKFVGQIAPKARLEEQEIKRLFDTWYKKCVGHSRKYNALVEGLLPDFVEECKKQKKEPIKVLHEIMADHCSLFEKKKKIEGAISHDLEGLLLERLYKKLEEEEETGIVDYFTKLENQDKLTPIMLFLQQPEKRAAYFITNYPSLVLQYFRKIGSNHALEIYIASEKNWLDKNGNTDDVINKMAEKLSQIDNLNYDDDMFKNDINERWRILMACYPDEVADFIASHHNQHDMALEYYFIDIMNLFAGDEQELLDKKGLMISQAPYETYTPEAFVYYWLKHHLYEIDLDKNIFCNDKDERENFLKNKFDKFCQTVDENQTVTSKIWSLLHDDQHFKLDQELGGLKQDTPENMMLNNLYRIVAYYQLAHGIINNKQLNTVFVNTEQFTNDRAGRMDYWVNHWLDEVVDYLAQEEDYSFALYIASKLGLLDDEKILKDIECKASNIISILYENYKKVIEPENESIKVSVLIKYLLENETQHCKAYLLANRPGRLPFEHYLSKKICVASSTELDDIGIDLCKKQNDVEQVEKGSIEHVYQWFKQHGGDKNNTIVESYFLSNEKYRAYYLGRRFNRAAQVYGVETTLTDVISKCLKDGKNLQISQLLHDKDNVPLEQVMLEDIHDVLGLHRSDSGEKQYFIEQNDKRMSHWVTRQSSKVIDYISENNKDFDFELFLVKHMELVKRLKLLDENNQKEIQQDSSKVIAILKVCCEYHKDNFFKNSYKLKLFNNNRDAFSEDTRRRVECLLEFFPDTTEAYLAQAKTGKGKISIDLYVAQGLGLVNDEEYKALLDNVVLKNDSNDIKFKNKTPPLLPAKPPMTKMFEYLYQWLELEGNNSDFLSNSQYRQDYLEGAFRGFAHKCRVLRKKIDVELYKISIDKTIYKDDSAKKAEINMSYDEFLKWEADYKKEHGLFVPRFWSNGYDSLLAYYGASWFFKQSVRMIAIVVTFILSVLLSKFVFIPLLMPTIKFYLLPFFLKYVPAVTVEAYILAMPIGMALGFGAVLYGYSRAYVALFWSVMGRVQGKKDAINALSISEVSRLLVVGMPELLQPLLFFIFDAPRLFVGIVLSIVIDFISGLVRAIRSGGLDKLYPYALIQQHTDRVYYATNASLFRTHKTGLFSRAGEFFYKVYSKVFYSPWFTHPLESFLRVNEKQDVQLSFKEIVEKKLHGIDLKQKKIVAQFENYKEQGAKFLADIAVKQYLATKKPTSILFDSLDSNKTLIVHGDWHQKQIEKYQSWEKKKEHLNDLLNTANKTDTKLFDSFSGYIISFWHNACGDLYTRKCHDNARTLYKEQRLSIKEHQK